MLSKNWKSIVAFLCILLVIAYTSIIFLPHAHDCVSSDCTVCALIETSRNTMIGLVLVATVHQLANILFTIYAHTNLYYRAITVLPLHLR